MHPRTAATLDQLRRVEWFANVGRQDTESAVVLSSWTEAMEHASSSAWEELCLEAANRYCERLLERSPARFNEWNAVVDRVKPHVELIVKEKCVVAEDLGQGKKRFVDTVKWDILHVCMEAEYADVFPPGFYASQAYWYSKGHFPCGWDGTFPAGRRIIY